MRLHQHLGKCHPLQQQPSHCRRLQQRPSQYQDLLTTIRPYPKAAPRTEQRRGRKRGKSTILTSNESFEEVESEHLARESKKTLAEKKKEAREEKKKEAALKKVEIAAKKLVAAQKKKKEAKASTSSAPVPARIRQRRATAAVVEYAENLSDSD